MSYEFLCKPLSPWQERAGDYGDVVIDSRIRLSRNLKNYVFPQRASDAELAAVFAEGQRMTPLLSAMGRGRYAFVDLDELTPLQRELMAAKHFVSAAHITKPASRAVIVRDDGAAAVMVNETDHFCIQTAAAGFDLSNAWDDASQIDDCLENKLNFAYRDDFGYLTASPSITGTGLIAGVTVHIPALVLMKRLNRIVQGITKFGFAVCGMYGERDEYIGNIFQISNQITLGVSEEDILGQLRKLIAQVVQEERNCRQILWTHDGDTMKDKFCRAYGTLSQAWLMSEQEGLSLLSDLRFGIDAGVISRPGQLYEGLLTAITPAYLQAEAGRELGETEMERERAAVIRRMVSAGDGAASLPESL
ncbi:ATP--guanido phosphotransferase [uncultured Megasphaera sp.]|uniref:ATP--guanido phosphotransferase n=1 Tax=uncultured Megasphaera sp. TaxID=165188 RepID=UPI00265D4103|nr:ATP--guanido phosphotransferase [uncultured Megasphaera sp.]